MPQERIDASHFSPDIQEFIRLLHRHQVRYVIIGGEAVIFYGNARLTGDVDFFYDRTKGNAERLHQALLDFWNGSIPGISTVKELFTPDLILQFGRPPNRIDLLSEIGGVAFENAWRAKQKVLLVFDEDVVPLYYIGLNHLIASKEAAGSPKDQDDLAYLRKAAMRDKG